MVRVWWNDRDRHRWVTLAAAVGLVLAGLMAVFGLPPIGLHTPLRYVGGVCPLCGMTRAVRLLVMGDVSEALRYNPASPLVLVGGIAVVVRWLYGRFTDRWVDLSVRWTPQLITVTTLVVGVLWIRQAFNTDLLIHDHADHVH